MNYSGFLPGEVVLIEHRPPDDPLAAKPRPVVVISSSAFNKGSIDVVVVPISSVIRHGDPTQILIEDSSPDFSGTGLKVTSVVKCGAVFACPKSLIRRRLGKIPAAVLAQIRGRLSTYLMSD